MNKADLKSYAPQARKDFIASVTARANQLGLSVKAGSLEVTPAQTQGDVTVIAGQAWPAKVNSQRDQLIERIRKDGFEQTMEAVAYTWFNRFAALRYMELHDYLGHGHRALSSSAGGLPEILTHATDLSNDLPGLNAAKVTELKLAGNRDGELYRMLLVAQCNALSRAMPFLFERIDDDSELLLPDNLLRSDSVIAKLVAEISEEDWAEVEIIGWLYQFYISEKKDQVIGKVVKSEDIPAATQLFTPNWIVQYLVQNSVGRLWLMANPQSTLAQEWPYYINPAEQTPEVQAQLDSLIQTRVREDGDTLNPESITVLDPACGSGHILVVAYDVLKAIYLERGYQPRAIPRLILEKNLYGLDIDDRAAQMAGFALLMKARADDRRLFTATDEAGNLQPPKLNVLSLQESKGLSVDELATHLAPFKVQRATITALVETFEHAKTFGSLIQIPYALKTHLEVLPEVLALVKQSGDMYASAAADDLLPLVQQAQVLAMQFDAVVANPPYMGSKYHCQELKKFVESAYRAGRADLYGVFTLRNIQMAKPSGYISMITFTSWMFLSSFEQLRKQIFDNAPISLLVHNGRGVWGSDFGTCAYVLQHSVPKNLSGRFLRLFEKQGSVASNEELERRFNVNPRFEARVEDFDKIPGSPVAYWLSNAVRAAFGHTPLEQITISEGQNKTADNDRFVRLGWEVDCNKVGRGKKWLSYAKGGAFRKWYGNLEHVVDWSDTARAHYRKDFSCRIIHESLWYEPGVSWTLLAYDQSFRYLPEAATFDMTGSSVFFKDSDNIEPVLGFLNSKVCSYLTNITNPTVALQIKNVRDLPVAFSMTEGSGVNAKRCVAIAKNDYCAYETALEFSELPLLKPPLNTSLKTLQSSYSAWIGQNRTTISEIKTLEEENNRFFVGAYGLADEITPEVADEKITLTVNPAYRYGGKLTEDEQWGRFRQDTMCELISYAIGCMMGRYSLDEPGLIYAHAGNVGFEPSRYSTFPADADGIVPITDELWFADDAPSRIVNSYAPSGGQTPWKKTWPGWPKAWAPKLLKRQTRPFAATSPTSSSKTTCKPTRSAPSTGSSAAANKVLFRHWSICIDTPKAHWPACAPNTLCPSPARFKVASRCCKKTPQPPIALPPATSWPRKLKSSRRKHAELLAYDEQLRHYADMRINLI
jgi:hypothetical protein